MKVKLVVFAAVGVLFGPPMRPVCKAVNTRDVEKIRQKRVLENRDLHIIENFIAEGVRELVNTNDFASIAGTRADIVRMKSPQPQFAQQLSESAFQYISWGFEQALRQPPDRRLKIVVNLLLLIDGLEELQLTELSKKMLNDRQAAVRYCAVHSMTNTGIVKQLNMGGTANLKTASDIVGELSNIINRANPETLALIVDFAGAVRIPQGQALLCRIADMRVKKYAAWTVEYELLDSNLLRQLADKIPPSSLDSSKPATAKADTARRFGQLYSYAMQRYIKGADRLNKTQKQHLASVIAEVEDKCLGKLLTRPQSTIRRALGNGDYATLQQEHERLFGEANKPGLLTSLLKISYGTDDGPKRATPLPLPDPPARLLSQ